MDPDQKLESLQRSFKQIPAKKRWQSLKPVFENLYVRERFRLNEVMAFMEVEYDFVAS